MNGGSNDIFHHRILMMKPRKHQRECALTWETASLKIFVRFNMIRIESIFLMLIQMSSRGIEFVYRPCGYKEKEFLMRVYTEKVRRV